MKIANEIKISVVVPTYNRAGTIKRCLKSVLAQTYLPYEIVVADDGSTDNTLEIIGNINSNLINVYSQENRGAQAARNLGIRMSKGNYIAFLDSDDEWVNNKLEIQVEILKNNPDSVIYTDMYMNDDKTGRMERCKANVGSGNIYKHLLITPGPTFPGILAPKKALEKVGLLDENVPSFQEWDCSLSLARNYHFIYIDSPLFIWHVYPGDRISNSKKKEIEGYIYQLKKYSTQIGEYYGAKEVFERANRIILKYAGYVSRNILDLEDIDLFEDIFPLWFSYGKKANMIPENANREKSITLLFAEQNRNVEREKIKKNILLSLIDIVKKGENRIAENIKKYNAKKIAIYGMDNIGIEVRQEFLREGVDVEYCIDKRGRITEKGDFKVYYPDEIEDTIDLIVVVPVYFFKEIECALKVNFDCPIISIESLIKT